MSDQVDEKAKQLEAQPAVKRALDKAVGKEATPVVVEKSAALWLVTHLVLVVAFGALYYLLGFKFFGFAAPYRELLQRACRGAVFIVIALAVTKAIEIYLIGRVQEAAARFNLRRIARLLSALVVVLIAVSVLFVNWYTAIVSLGLISLILGFALQTPITSFIGWVYILVREPFRVGDRIKIGEATGDVIDVSYLDTTLWEFGGQYLSTDHPSGRLIKFPNSKVLNSTIYNYSWPLFPYVWNEIKFNISYDSDLQFVERTMRETAAAELGEAMMERVKVYRELLAQTPVDELDVQERPSVQFRVSENTWLEAIVRYLVNPKEAGRVKTALIKKLLADLNAAPEKVGFPKGTNR